MGQIARFFQCKTCETSWSSKAYRKTRSQCPNEDCANEDEVREVKKKRKYYGCLFGHFSCNECANRWASAFAYHRIWQKCKECLAKAMPHSMMEHEIKKGKPKAKGKPHLADLCGMCSTGKPCKIVRDNQLPDVIDALVRVSLTG